MICPRCFTENADRSKFCCECGFDLRGSTLVLPDLAPEEAALPPESTLAFPSGASGPQRAVASSASTEPFAAGQVPGEMTLEELLSYARNTQDLGGTAAMPAVGGADASGADRMADPFAPASDGGRSVFASASDGADGSKPPRAPMPRKKLMAIIAAVAALVLLLAGAGITYALELWGGKSVPDVVGMDQAKARTTLEEAGFSVTALQVKSDDTEDTVILTDPAPGARAGEGSEVAMHVACARVVPEIVGVERAEAEALLADEGFMAVTWETEKSNEAEGTVLAVDPAPGTKAKGAAPVTVKVAEAFVVPDIAGMSADEAVAALEAEGYEVERAQVNTEDVAEGLPVTTEPVAGTKLDSGSTVTLYLAHNRSTELIALTKELFEDAQRFKAGSTSYELMALGEVTYSEANRVSFTLRAKPYEVVELPFGLGSQTYYGDEATISGNVLWTDANRVDSISSSAGSISIG